MEMHDRSATVLHPAWNRPGEANLVSDEADRTLSEDQPNRVGQPPNRIERHSLAVSQRELDDHIAALISTHPGIGAVVIDHAGHVRLYTAPAASPGDPGFTLVPGVYSSIQAAIDAATDGDVVYIAAGTYREQLTIRGKHLDLLGATGDDGTPLVTLEAPDTGDLDIDPVESREGKLIARCALVRIRNDAHATVRNLVIDGRHQGWVLRRTGAQIEFKSVTTDNADTIIDHVQTRNFDSTEAVQLLDSSGHLRTSYPTIQEAINAAAEGDEVVIAAGMYAEDLYIDQPITLSRANVDRVSERIGVKALIIGRVAVAASAINVTLDGIAIEGHLELDCIAGATASLTLRNSRIEGRHTTTGIQARHVDPVAARAVAASEAPTAGLESAAPLFPEP